MLAAGAAIALATTVGAPAAGVTVTPAGAPFTVTGALTLTNPFLGNIVCAQSDTGTVPPAPLNSAPSGAVIAQLSLSMTCIPTGTTTANATFGAWTVSWNVVGTTVVATLTLPDSALVTNIGCSLTRPWGDPVTLTGTWAAATSAAAFTNQQIDLANTCGLAPSTFERVNGTLTFSSGGAGLTVTTP